MTFFVDARSGFYLAAIFKVCSQMVRGLGNGIAGGSRAVEIFELSDCLRQNSNGHHENTPHAPAHRQTK